MWRSEDKLLSHSLDTVLFLFVLRQGLLLARTLLSGLVGSPVRPRDPSSCILFPSAKQC